MTEPKEPNYFARSLSLPGGSLSRQDWHTSLASWEQLFEAASPDTLVAGEASTRYLRCKDALSEIKHRFPDAMLIVCIRNPMDLVESWHAQKVYEEQEDLFRFDDAWAAQWDRMYGIRDKPKGLETRDAVNYAMVASLGTQIRQLLGIFSTAQVHFLLQEDLSCNTQKTYSSVLEFLGVDQDNRIDFPRLNTRKERLKERGGRLTRMFRSIRREFTGNNGIGKPVPASPAMRAELQAYFAPEVRMIEAIIGRSLSHWLPDRI